MSCAVVARGGVRACLVGGGTIQSHSPAVNSAPDAARMCRRDTRCAWMPAHDVCDVFRRTPYIADLKPGGRYVAKDLFEIGGVPVLMKALLDGSFLHGDCMTVTGKTLAENLRDVAL